MTNPSEQVEAIDRAIGVLRRYSMLGGDECDTARLDLANARDALIAAVERDGLAHEIAKAAGEISNGPSDESAPDIDRMIYENNERWKRLDALLAKYTEATND